MGVVDYPDVQYTKEIWHPVALHRRRLGDIWMDEQLSDQPTAPCARDFLDAWCQSRFDSGWWASEIQVHHVIWIFRDVRDAVLFKLTWGGA